MEEVTAQKIKDEFRDSINPYPQAIEQFVQLCKNHNITAEQLFCKWEQYVFHHMQTTDDQDLPLTPENVNKFIIEVIKELSVKRPTNSVRSSIMRHQGNTPLKSGIYTADTMDNLIENIYGEKPSPNYLQLVSPRKGFISPSVDSSYLTPKRSQNKTFPAFSPGGLASPKAPTPQAIKFAERLNKSKVEDSFNDILNNVIDASKLTQKHRCKIKSLKNQQFTPYRTMFQRLGEKSENLDDQIEYLAKFLENEALSSPSQASQSTILTFGRICADSNSKMNDQSVVLESSRQVGGGVRVKLNLNDINQFSLFPGKIIGCQGINNSGDLLSVSAFIETPLPCAPLGSIEEVKYYNQNLLENQPLKIAISSGAYTLDDNLEFDPFKQWLEELTASPPDVIILLGPFLDERHPLIQNADLDMMPLDILKLGVCQPIQQYAQKIALLGRSTSFLIIPSVNDILHPSPVYPQSPYPNNIQQILRQYGNHCSMEFLPNPAQCFLNESLFAITSLDTLTYLSSEEVARYPVNQRGDRLGRLCRHMIQQRSFLPLFPPPVSVNVELKKWEAYQLFYKPDFLITVSQLKYFIKNVEDVICINPGPLTKMQSGGTYCVLIVHPPDLNESEVTESSKSTLRDLNASLINRCRVDILRV